MRVFGYTRVSTDEQRDGASLAEQERKIGAVATFHGYDAPTVVTDVISGSVALQERPKGKPFWQSLQRGDTVIVSKLDRVFRSAEDALTTARILQERGVNLILTDMGVEPVTGNGISKLFFTLLAGFAEFERWRIKERANEGRAGKLAKGGHIGGDAPFGWRVEGTGKGATLVEVEAEQATIARARELQAEAGSLRKLSARLAAEGHLDRQGKAFHPVKLERILKRAVGAWAPPSRPSAS
jgi:DNA invertase Pin-like site-specific DNA recombinase